MHTLSKHLFTVLFGTALISSCSRPVAYFQPTAREQFTSVKPAAEASTLSVETTQPVVAQTPTADVAPVSSPGITPAPAEQLAQTKQAISQVEAYVRNDSKLASNKKLTNRMAKLSGLLTTATDKAAIATNAASAKKMTFMERTMLKKMDKKIRNHVAPEKTNAMNSNVRLGLIIGLIGLLLWLLGGGSILGLIGLIGFVVGLVLILLGVINT
ncbi:hypothetical protein [Spirosoma areae]